MIQLIGSNLYQWELGRQVRLTTQSTSIIPELHFVDYTSPNALVVVHKLVDGEIVYDVPNILLQQTMDIVVYIVLRDGDKKEVIGTKTFVVTPKQRGTDYVYTPTEIKGYEALEKRIEALEQSGGNGTGGGIEEETDPTVPEWAKQLTKPSYTAEEVGALPKNTKLPTKLSDLENDLELEVEGTVEITDGEPTKESTVMTLNPNAEEVNLYTAEEVDERIGEWELIVDHTVEENCSKVEFTEDVNGLPFNLRKILVITEILPNTVDELTANNYLKLDTDSGKNAFGFSISGTPKSSETMSISYAILEKIQGIVWLTECRKGSNYSSISDTLTVSNNYSNNAMIYAESYICKKIDRLLFVSHSNAIGAGSKIKVYGIREVAES